VSQSSVSQSSVSQSSVSQSSVSQSRPADALGARRRRQLVVPIDLGGSPVRCRLRPPLRPPPAPETVSALVEHYRSERSGEAELPVEVAFFHGGCPSESLVEAAGPYSLRLSCSPADVERHDIERLRDDGLSTVEVELLSLHRSVLSACRRGYTASRALSLLQGLRELGLRVGAVLAPGLPASSHDGVLADARRLCGGDGEGPLVDFVRILPTLAWAGSGLSATLADGRWRPMSLGEAVTTCADLLDVFDDAGVAVARVGLQPGADLPVRAVAGPVHPNLRGLVEVRRFRQRMTRALDRAPRGHPAVLAVHPKDLSWAKGTANENLRYLRARHRLAGLRVRTESDQPRGSVRLVS